MPEAWLNVAPPPVPGIPLRALPVSEPEEFEETENAIRLTLAGRGLSVDEAGMILANGRRTNRWTLDSESVERVREIARKMLAEMAAAVESRP